MKIPERTIVLCTGLLLASTAFAGGDQWVNLNNETATRFPAGALGSSDTEEKDFAWGDVDQDGDIDLISVRKQEFTNSGERVNVLYMNEGIADGQAINGVFVDRTAQYASASDMAGDLGFMTATNDRDVVLVDLNNDTWLDMVTAPTLSDGDQKHISHPRVYMNLGEVAGVWQGFEYQDARIPIIAGMNGAVPHAPRFCSVAAADLTGDGYVDLYFGDYDSGGGQTLDFNNRVLVNQGAGNPGFFSEQTTTVLPTSQMRNSAFGASTVLEDMNGDGVTDIVKQTSLNNPLHVAINYNNPANEGVMNIYDEVYSLAPYFVTVGDLDNNGRLDMVLTDDNNDKYMLNTGNGGDGAANFTQHNLLLEGGGTESFFGGNSWIADLDEDGWLDVIVTDVDVDIPNCGADRTHIYRNLGGTPGNITLREQGQIIPNNMLGGAHDVAVFDINGDGTLDIILGRCSTTEVWMQESNDGLSFSFPTGVPSVITPDTPTTVQVQVNPDGKGVPVPDTGVQYVSVNGGAYTQSSMNHLGGNLYELVIPGVACADSVNFYVEAEMQGGIIFTDPPNAPATTYSAVAATGSEIAFEDAIEGDVSAWTIQSDASLTSGEWEQADPNGTLSGTDIVAPEDDNTPDGFMAFVTENGPPGGTASATDVDGGPTYLISPVINLEGSDATISFAAWVYSAVGEPDVMTVEVSNDDGDNYELVAAISTTGDGETTAWDPTSFIVSDFVDPTAFVRVRFTASDSPNNSVTEAGIDDFSVEALTCGGDACVGDLDDTGDVGTGDLLLLLSAWGTNGPGADIAEPNNIVNASDLLAMLAAWGTCP